MRGAFCFVAFVATAWLLWGCRRLVRGALQVSVVASRWADRCEIEWLLSRAAARVRAESVRRGAKGGKRHGH